MLGVLAALWPSSLVPVEGGTHLKVVIGSPAGEIAFALPSKALRRMWHVPEVADRVCDEDAARLRDDRLVQLASGITPMPPLEGETTNTRVTDRRRRRDVAGD
ncbi:hypothetical protein AB0O47_38825 [Streptomyces noursei]|uniref:hypothetical protein n=1 Tax=Streptomyces noursei TaxID=1971 RepID=UPI00344D5666